MNGVNDETSGRGRGWPWFLAGLLSLQALGCAAVVWIALSDPSQAVEPNYDDKALHWDARKALARESAALGWHAEIETSAQALEVRMTDRTGAPVVLDRFEAQVFHHARGRDRKQLVLSIVDREQGLYRAPFAFSRAGLWEIRLRGRRGAERFVLRQVVEVGSDGRRIW